MIITIELLILKMSYASLQHQMVIIKKLKSDFLSEMHQLYKFFDLNIFGRFWLYPRPFYGSW